MNNNLQAQASNEATKIEQSRAFAEVMIQAELAHRFPRNMETVFKRIDETFERTPALVARSKYEYTKGAKIIGYTVEFARAVAECVGNIDYSFKELSRSENQSEIMVSAWDLETNTTQRRSFIVRHVLDLKSGQKKPLVQERDIYENNANLASRRLRECILGVLPASARRHAEDIVEILLKQKFPDQKLGDYAKKAIEKFKNLGVTKEEVIAERGNRPLETWTRNDLATLGTHFEDIDKGDKTVDDIFRPHIIKEHQRQNNKEQNTDMQDARPINLKAHKKQKSEQVVEPVSEPISEPQNNQPEENEFEKFENESGWVDDLCRQSKRLYSMKDDPQYTDVIQSLIIDNDDFNADTIEIIARENDQYKANGIIERIANRKLDLDKANKKKK